MKRGIGFRILLLSLIVNTGWGQQLKIRDFAIWGGSAPATAFNNNQGVFISSKVIIDGSVGSNHQVTATTGISIKGNIFSGNKVSLSTLTAVQGDINAAKKATSLSGALVNLGSLTLVKGNVNSFGKVEFKENKGILAGTITGKVAIPAPTTSNYFGPSPKGGFSNSPQVPLLPVMPNNTPFDSKVGAKDITSSQILSPGTYKTLALTGNQTLTLEVGNYIFKNVVNVGSNKIIFNLKGSTTATINIYIINDANWGKVEAQMINGNAPSQVYTEVHGNGATNTGYAFDVADGSPKNAGTGNYNWVGSVWAPNGGINIRTTGTVRQNGFLNIAGALWSGLKVNLGDGIIVSYKAPKGEQNFIDPYYPPPVGGKVAPANNIIGAELLSLAQNPSAVSSILNNNIFRIVNNTVLIEIISKLPNDADLVNRLSAAGMTGIINNGPDRFVITGYVPLGKLLDLQFLRDIVYIRPAFPAILNAGQVTSQGDLTMKSNNVRSRFGVDGEGVKVGVLSDSYNTKQQAQHDVDEGDLPGIKSNGQPSENATPVQILQDLSEQKSDEGRAMLQIVHDVAPKAKLAFTTGFLTAGNFANGIKALADPGLAGGRCDILVDDITYITEPFLRDGIVAQTVEEVVNSGVTYFSSAGNFGERSYENAFQGVSDPSIIPAPATLHKFGSANSQTFQTLKLKPGSYTIVLQWSDDFYSLGGSQGVRNDLDLYLLNSTGFTLFGFNRSNLFGDPFEVCPFVVKEETEAKLMVVNATGVNSGNIRFKYIIFSGDGTIVDFQNGNSSIVGHANSNSAIAVGAMLYANIPAYTPVYPSVASFSSRGGTQTLNASNAFVPRQKPDIIAPNGVNTTVNLGGAVLDDGDAYPNFFGTSAAAPHAAAAGALILQARKKFGLQLRVTPAEIRGLMISSAGKFPNQTNLPTYTEGYGFVRADAAVQEIANARPIITSWQPVITGTQPGALPFNIAVKGEYLTTDSRIFFNGVALATTVSPDKTSATATIPPIVPGDDPPLQLFNGPKSISGLDGGLSEALHFFSSKADVTIRAQNKNRKFRQANPTFTPEVLVNGVPIAQTNITLADLKLDGNNISYSTLATPESSTGLYGIIPSRRVPINANDPILLAYGFTFVSGTLAIEKMPLKITPRNQTIKYGDFPVSAEFDYQLDNAEVSDPALLNEVSLLYKKYLANNAVVVMNDLQTQSPVINDSDLNNIGMVASFQAIRNGRQYSLINGQLSKITGPVLPADIGTLRYLIDVSAASFNNYRQNPAQSVMVTGFAGENERALLSIKSLANGSGKTSLSNGQLQPVVNGQLLAMVNGQLQAVVNGQLQAVVNAETVVAEDIIFRNGQLLALVNGVWKAATNGQLQAVVNGQNVTLDLTVLNGQLQAVVNGQLMALVNGQLQAVVNGQTLTLVNGQLQALVNGQLLPVVNGQLLAVVNGHLQAVVNGQLMAVVNGQLMAVVNGKLELVESIALSNGQLQAVVNGQLLAIVNGQLKAMVNGVISDVPNPTLVNGQLQAVVNGQLQALVNGQLQAVVNGQLQPIINGDLVAVSTVQSLQGGKLRAVVGGVDIPIKNGQLQAVVNGQLLAMVNGQLMAVVNGQLTFTVLKNGQLQAVVNGQLQPIVNGQLLAVVNSQLSAVSSYTITNGQLQAVVNGQTMVLVNNQLLALSNGQLQPVVNNFDVSGTNNNSKTLVLVDEDDLTLQGGALGGMFSVNMVTGLSVGTHRIYPGAFLDRNYETTYGSAQLQVVPLPLVIKANDITKTYGEVNPPLTITGSGFAYDDDLSDITAPTVSTIAGTSTGAGQYAIIPAGGSAVNYSIIPQNGIMNILKKPLTITADNKTKAPGEANPPLTITYTGLITGDTKADVCAPLRPKLPKALDQLERTSTYTDVKLNNTTNKLTVTPGSSVTLTANWTSIINTGNLFCPGCVTQHYIGIKGIFTTCHDVSGFSPLSGVINSTFTAPAVPGVYYITQISSWEFNCFDRGAGLDYDNSNANDAIAVLVVQNEITSDSIFATTTAVVTSTAGSYPITLTGCNSPNYDITYFNGMLSVGSTQRNSGLRTGSFTEQKVEDIKTQVEEIVGKTGVVPNPASSVIRVGVTNDVASLNGITIVDVTGRVQPVRNIKKLSAKLFEIDVSALRKAVYFIKVRTVKNEEVFRFLKL